MRLMLATVVACCLARDACAQDFDLLIKGGRVVDGTGNPAFFGDVAIKQGRIAAVGRLSDRTAARIIDAAGLTVAPGFVDIHNHSDSSVLADANAESMVRQGVTSMILGEGGSAAPSEEFPDFARYFAELIRRGISTNIGSYVGSSTVWVQSHGPRPGKPSPEALETMRTIVRKAMQDGALGVASSLSGPPGAWIDIDSLVAMCEAAAPYGGIYSTHMRTEGEGVFEAVDEALEIARRARVPVDIIHLKIAEKKLWGSMPRLVAKIAQARAEGADAQANVYPYRAGQNDLASIIPPWAHEGGRRALVERIQDPANRQRLKREIVDGLPGWYNHYTASGGFPGMQPASFSHPRYKTYEGKRMDEILAAIGGDPLDAFLDLLTANGGSVPTVYFHHDEQDMRYALAQPFVSIGSDGTAVKTEGPLREGHPHPRYYGTFPRVLGRYVREARVLTLEEAVRKMTSANTAKIHVYDRGLLRVGQWADVTVFDAGRIIDHATFEMPHQYATGVEYLLVNGVLVLERGKHTGARPGAIVYGPGKR